MVDASIKDRMAQYLEYKSISDYRLEKDLGLSKGYWNKAKNPSADVINRFSCFYSDISADWLLRGEGNMLRDMEGVNDATIIPIANSKAVEKIHPISEFDLYDIDVSAGLNRLFSEDGERQRAYLGKISIPNMPKCDGAVKVVGDSMYPLLKSGDIIAYKVVHDMEAVQWGEIYILQLSYGQDTSIVVKYVKRSDKGEDYISLVSYNKEHDTKDVHRENVSALARVMICIRQMGVM